MAVLAVAVGVGGQATGALRSVERDTVDIRFDVRGAREAPPDVAVVGVDDVTFDELRDRRGDRVQWPFPRSLHARLIDRLHAAGAKVIAYDVQFTEPTSEREDNALIDAVAEAGNVVLATTEVGEDGGHAVFGGEDVVRELDARVGNAILVADAGGVIRRVPAETDGLRSFAVVAAERFTGRPVAAGALPRDGAWIDFPGPPGTVRTYSFSRVLDGRVDPSAFRGRVVVVGATAPSLRDVNPTAASGDLLMAGPETQAAAIDTLLRGAPLRETGLPVELAIILLLGLVAPVATLRLSPLRAFALAAGAGALYVAVVGLAFGEGHILPVLWPLTALTLSAVLALATEYLTARWERERVRDAFRRYVPERVVDTVLQRAGDDGWLTGERREATVLFSDLRGFTTFSEGRPPDEVLAILNVYLSEMTDAIMEHGGAALSYMGDGIMAVFGAPMPYDDHADRGLRAALAMQERLAAFNERDRQGQEPFRMGIGLNAGPVMAGNIGSERRLEYTLIGDTVNTASRLESMTKNSGYDIFVADSVRSRLSEVPAELEFVAELEVRGRSEGVRVWGIACDSDTGRPKGPADAAGPPAVVATPG